jgi:hypothetical protein
MAGFFSAVRQDELEGKAIRYPDKTRAKGYVVTFIDDIVTAECIAQMRV